MPPSMSRRLVANVLLRDVAPDGKISVTSSILLAKTRSEERVFFTGERRDRLVPAGDGFRLCERCVILDDAVLVAENLSLLF